MTFRFGAALWKLNDITPDDILSFLDAPPMKTGGSGRGDRATHLRSLLRFLLAIRETLARDDKHLAEGRERERKSEHVKKRGQTKKQPRKTAKRKRKGRYQSRGLRM